MPALARILGALGLLAASLARAEEPDPTAIARGFDEHFARTCNAGDVAALIELYTDDATAIFPGEREIARGRAEIEPMLKRLCDPKSGTTLRLDGIEARRLAPDVLLLVGQWTILVKGADGSTAENPARATEILVRSGGRWRYALDHASAAPPPPSAK